MLLEATVGRCVCNTGISVLLDNEVGAIVSPVDEFGASVMLRKAAVGRCVFDSGISVLLDNEVGAAVAAVAGASVAEFGATVVLLGEAIVGLCVVATGVSEVTLVEGVGAAV